MAAAGPARPENRLFFFVLEQQLPGRSEDFGVHSGFKEQQETRRPPMNYAKIIAIHNKAMEAHEDGIEAAKAEVDQTKKKDESDEAFKARVDGDMAKIDMLDFQGAHELEQQLFQALSKVQEKEGQTVSSLIQNI
jgi:hypothetical protein